ncbi:MAG TPA: flagellar basal body rod protein FlgC [Candidatus Gastranaerophilales bacterium]|nr:flagellar basal body rod protein FlgC [Candidatus Gastranaerophilales bacterium]
MSILKSFNVSESGLHAHARRLEIHAINLANLNTPNYSRKIPTISSKDDISFGNVLNNMKDETFSTGSIPNTSAGVSFTGVIEDPTLGDLEYAPGHPDADENGYIRRSNVNPMVDMADSILTSRAYEANIAVMGITKAMAQKATEIGR